jgi:hypothetical protein
MGANERVEITHRVGAHRPVHQRALHHEPVDVGVGLDDPEVGIDRHRQLSPWLALVGQRQGELAHQPFGDSGADRQVELAPVGEVAIDRGLAGAGFRGHLVHPDAGTVGADGPHRRVDELFPAGASMGVPAGTPSVRCLDRHGPDGT